MVYKYRVPSDVQKFSETLARYSGSLISSERLKSQFLVFQSKNKDVTVKDAIQRFKQETEDKLFNLFQALSLEQTLIPKQKRLILHSSS